MCVCVGGGVDWPFHFERCGKDDRSLEMKEVWQVIRQEMKRRRGKDGR